jgi:hypothetical protein
MKRIEQYCQIVRQLLTVHADINQNDSALQTFWGKM